MSVVFFLDAAKVVLFSINTTSLSGKKFELTISFVL